MFEKFHNQTLDTMKIPQYALALHAGAGTIPRNSLSFREDTEIREHLREAARRAGALLENGRSALEAVCVAVHILEDAPAFNAGRGAVFSAEGQHELEASLMCGRAREGGAAMMLRRVKNPILLADLIRTRSEYVCLSGAGAEAFAKAHGLDLVDPSYFYTSARYAQLKKARAAKQVLLDHEGKFGTVGAVARDTDGNLAAATSTGGMTNKRAGRIGDSAILGAGTYADNDYAAISTTGHGEAFMRSVLAYDVVARMKYAQGITLAEASRTAITENLARFGRGGLIAIGRNGVPVFGMNTSGMYRAALSAGERHPRTAIYADEELK